MANHTRGVILTLNLSKRNGPALPSAVDEGVPAVPTVPEVPDIILLLSMSKGNGPAFLSSGGVGNAHKLKWPQQLRFIHLARPDGRPQ
jgi:hypothetical protein